MASYLSRLATTGFAYTAASLLSKLVAVLLLPVYTRYLTAADYGAAEVLVTAVIAASIVARFGVIEALLRFYYLPDERGERVIATGFAALLAATTVASALALPFADPISEALLGSSEPGLVRLAIGGLWVFTLYEYLVALLRLDERSRAYFWFTMANVVAAIPLTVWLVVFAERGAEGLLIGTYGAALPFLAWLAVDQRRRLALIPDLALLRRMLRWGLPTMPAELSLYALQFIDRIALARLAGLTEAGLYALAFKFSQAINVIVRGFQLAWPPLAYSIVDDAEARRAYALIATWFSALCAFIVIGMWLEARWIVRLLAAPEFFSSYEAVGLLALGGTLYALYLVLVVVLGRTGRTELNLPATAAAVAANLGLNLVLIPPLGIVGAGIALVASYGVVLALMYVFTQRLFSIPYEGARLLALFGLAAVLIAGGELLLPTEGVLGLLSRTALWLSYPAALWIGGFPTPGERERIRALARPGGLRTALARARSEPAEAHQGPAERDTPVELR